MMGVGKPVLWWRGIGWLLCLLVGKWRRDQGGELYCCWKMEGKWIITEKEMKSHLVERVLGNEEEYGLDYDETFAPAA
jgi:hypothetical protein